MSSAIPNEPVFDLQRGELTPAWREFFNELLARLAALEGA